jgi:hypothetical protein
MAGEPGQGGNSRRITSRISGRCCECSRTVNLGRRLADQVLKQGGDPDEARRARGKADFLTTRAVKLDSEEVKKLREQVIELLRPQGGSSQSGN